MNDGDTPLSILKSEVSRFISERKWEKYHSPKNIAESIVIEASELLELFQWLDIDESWEYARKNIDKVSEELADIIIYCLSMANRLDIDVTQAVLKKLEENRRRYPVDKYLGRFYKER